MPKPRHYTFPCKLKTPMTEEIKERIVFGGSLEVCLHFCPNPEINGNVNQCPTWLSKTPSAKRSLEHVPSKQAMPKPKEHTVDRSSTGRLIELLKQTEKNLEAEEKRRRSHFHVIWGLREKRKNVERQLHATLKPTILGRDSYRCRACGSNKNLELARLYTGDNARPEKVGKRTIWKYPQAEIRWAEENMLTLCKECHKLFDSLNARLWRRCLGNLTIEEAVELLRSGKLKEVPPNLTKLSQLRRTNMRH